MAERKPVVLVGGQLKELPDGDTLPPQAPSAHVHTNAVAAGDAGFMTGADKSKLDGIAAGANNYTHPANHPPSIITQDASNRFVTDAEKSAWDAKQAALVSGTSIKTVNGDSLLGSGNLAISGGGFSSMVSFTVSGTWTVPASVTRCRVTVVGGGGGGGGARAGAGGAGGAAIRTYTLSGGSATIVVGSGGASGASGGDSTFTYSGTTITGAGGGAPSGVAGGMGGAGSGGDLNFIGGDGGSGASTGLLPGTCGGNSIFGGGGRGETYSGGYADDAQNGKANTGGGGGGSTGGGSSGAPGGSGVVVIEY